MAQQDNTLQPNWPAYETRGALNSPQSTENAAAAKAAEASINNCLGAGWAAVGSPAQAKANTKGVGALPSGATGRKTPINARGVKAK